MQRQLREHGRADIKLFDNPSLNGFRSTLDGEMKRLNATGNYLNKKQAQPITQEQENRLWELGLLGDHNAQVLLNTIVYQVGYFFALRSGNEHRRLRHSPSQIQLHEPPGDRAYLVYREDISKLTREVLQAKRKNQRKCINMLMSKTQGGVSYGFISFITLSVLKIVLPMLCTSLHCQNQRRRFGTRKFQWDSTPLAK